MESLIAKHYENECVLVTGATGFMGKILLEKLLRSCPKLKTIYILIRCKKGKTSQERIEELIKSPVFDKIRTNPTEEKSLRSRLICIEGDIIHNNLRLSNDDENELRTHVTTIFHMAANVRFDQSLRNAILMNTRGTLNLLELSKTFENLKAFIHVSTSYCHCDQIILEEKLYNTNPNPEKILDLLTWMDDKMLDELTPKLLKNSPNTYAYTKALTEQLLSEYSKQIPIAIARPSIGEYLNFKEILKADWLCTVTAAWKEPIPGWVDNLNGPTGLMVGAGKGVIRTMHCNPNFPADLVPVDSTINSLILIGWNLANSQSNGDVQVYNLTANQNNRITWGEALEMGRKHFYDNPFSICLWYPNGSIKSSYYAHVIAVFFFHTIPAYLVDFLMYITGNPMFLIRTQKRISNGLKILQYYTTRDWNFRNANIEILWNNLNNIDKKIFYTNSQKIDYNNYLLNYVLGARKYCVKEDDNTIPAARKLLKKLYYIDMITTIFFICLLLWFLSGWLFDTDVIMKKIV